MAVGKLTFQRVWFVVGALAVSACTVDPERTLPAPDGAACPALPDGPPQEVAIASGKTLSSQPGDGVGVFVAYLGGGRWQVSTACDTARSGAFCDYTLWLGSPDGVVSQPQPVPPNPHFGRFETQSDGALLVTFRTSYEWDTFTVDVETPESKPTSNRLSLRVWLDACELPSLVFWEGPTVVHMGAPSSPVVFVPTTP